MNYYRRYLGDYMGKTMHLSMMEHGAYNVLLDAYYSTEMPLPADYDALYRVCRAMSKTEKEAVKRVVDAFFPIGADGQRHNPRADKEIATAQATIKKQRESAVKTTVNRTVKRQSTVTVNQDLTAQETGRSTRQPSTTNLQPSTNQPPPPRVASAEKRPRPDDEKAKAKTSETWLAYAKAYRRRYGVDPTPNAKVRSQLSQFVDRVGIADAPEIAAFYVTHNKAFYVSRQHVVGLLLADAEGLRTQWLNGRTVTDTEARQADRKQNHLSIAEKLIAESRNGN